MGTKSSLMSKASPSYHFHFHNLEILFPSSGAMPTTALPWPTRPTTVLFPIGSTWHLMGSLSSWSDRVFSSASLLSSIIRALASSPALLPFTQSLQEKRSLFGEISNFKQHRRRTCFQDALSPLDIQNGVQDSNSRCHKNRKWKQVSKVWIWPGLLPWMVPPSLGEWWVY